jgi:hypothetical protein
MKRQFLRFAGAFALFGTLLSIAACSDDEGDGKSSSSSSGSASSSSDESHSFCLGNSGWKCPTADAKAACIKGSCGDCQQDPSQCKSSNNNNDNNSNDEEE